MLGSASGSAASSWTPKACASMTMLALRHSPPLSGVAIVLYMPSLCSSEGVVPSGHENCRCGDRTRDKAERSRAWAETSRVRLPHTHEVAKVGRVPPRLPDTRHLVRQQQPHARPHRRPDLVGEGGARRAARPRLARQVDEHLLAQVQLVEARRCEQRQRLALACG